MVELPPNYQALALGLAIPRSSEGLTLETSLSKSFTVVIQP